nr:S9 family peptidase [Sandarakinorhabdus sp.]
MLRSAPVAALLLASAAVAQAPVPAPTPAAPVPAPTPAAPVPAPTPAVPVPAAITADGVPAIPLALADRLRPYLENRSASFRDWDPVTKGALVS